MHECFQAWNCVIVLGMSSHIEDSRGAIHKIMTTSGVCKYHAVLRDNIKETPFWAKLHKEWEAHEKHAKTLAPLVKKDSAFFTRPVTDKLEDHIEQVKAIVVNHKKYVSLLRSGCYGVINNGLPDACVKLVDTAIAATSSSDYPTVHAIVKDVVASFPNNKMLGECCAKIYRAISDCADGDRRSKLEAACGSFGTTVDDLEASTALVQDALKHSVGMKWAEDSDGGKTILQAMTSAIEILGGKGAFGTPRLGVTAMIRQLAACIEQPSTNAGNMKETAVGIESYWEYLMTMGDFVRLGSSDAERCAKDAEKRLYTRISAVVVKVKAYKHMLGSLVGQMTVPRFLVEAPVSQGVADISAMMLKTVVKNLGTQRSIMTELTGATAIGDPWNDLDSEAPMADVIKHANATVMKIPKDKISSALDGLAGASHGLRLLRHSPNLKLQNKNRYPHHYQPHVPKQKRSK